MPQLAQTEKLTIHYFNMKGAAGLATLCLEQGNCDYEATAHSWDDWQNNFKPKTPTGLMPLFEYSDGTMVPESGALSRVAAAQAGLLGEGRDFARSEMLMGMTADMWKQVGGNAPTIMTVQNGTWTPEKATAWHDEFKPKIKKLLERYPQFLLDSGDSFTSATTVGELELWYRMYQLVAGPYGEILEEVPGMQKFYHRMSNLKGPKALVEDRTKFGSLMNYFVPVPA